MKPLSPKANRIWRLALVTVLALMLASAGAPGSTRAGTTAVKNYIAVFNGTTALDGTFIMDRTAALAAVSAAGGTVTADLSRQIGVLLVQSASDLFAQTLRATGLVEAVGDDLGWHAFPSYEEAISSGELVVGAPGQGGGGPNPHSDPFETFQWDMRQINAPSAHEIQAGWRAVDVGIIDSGIDTTHPEFNVGPNGSNIDRARARSFVPTSPDPLTDAQFHGTHVAGTVAAMANGLGVVGVAPNVTLVPIKVCDTAGYCYAGPVVQGITYAGDIKLDVINMSFFVDDNDLLQSTEFKCSNVEAMRAIKKAVERAVSYARNQGVTPIAALGNSDVDLAHPPAGNECEVVPAETQGVVGTMALGRNSEKASYSNYGTGMTDVAAPGGNGQTGDPNTTIYSTLPGGQYGSLKGTSMASPHTTGVAALIVSQFGQLGTDGDVKMPPQQVENYLQSTTVDIGLPGYDKCFGNGRIDALRAVTHDTSRLYDAQAPYCAEYGE